MSDKITFDSSIEWLTEDAVKNKSQEELKNAIKGEKGGQVMWGFPKQRLDTDIASPKQANVVKDEGEAQRGKEIEEGKKAGEEALKEDYNYGGDRYGTEEAAAAIGKSTAGVDVYDVTGVGSKGAIHKAQYQKDKNREAIKEQVDVNKQKRLALDEIENKLKIKSVTRDGEKIYQVGDEVFESKSDANDYINTEKEKIEEQRKEIGQDETKIAGKNVYKSKSEEIDDALKYRGIGYLNWIRKKGIINDEEYKKYRDQIQEVRDIRKPGIAKALNTAYLIYNAIANGFRNMGNLAFNVAGKGQVQYSQSALGNMLENAFEKAQEVNVAREKGAMEDVFDWQKSKRGLVLDSEKAFRDWGIKARENWSEWDRQTATNVISSFLLKDQKAFDEHMRRSAYSWDKTFAADFGKYLNKMSKKERQDFISGLFVQAADSPDGLIKMLTSLTTMPRQSAYRYYFENDAEYFNDIENAIDNLEISEEDKQKLIDEYEKEKLKQEEEKLKQDKRDGWNKLNKIIPANTNENAAFSKRIENAKSTEEINGIIADAERYAGKQ